MKKIGILTWHYLDNYGSVLQAYAMMKLFQDEETSVELINYRENAKTGMIYDWLRKIKYALPQKDSIARRKQRFYKFRKRYLRESKMYHSLEQLKAANLHYDALICGSDQIWSSKRFNEAYFLTFAQDDVLKYSYAASAIEDDYSENQQKVMKDSLARFEMISVREAKGVEILTKLSDNVPVVEVLDPTLMIDAKVWEQLAQRPTIATGNYVLCYFIGEDDKYQRITEELKRMYQCDMVININIKNIHQFGDHILRSASPQEFLGLIRHAKLVLSDSYHAILFAMNFQRDFYAIERFEANAADHQNERITNILRHIGCEDRYINYRAHVRECVHLDYAQITARLNIQRNHARNYIHAMRKEIHHD